MAWKGAMNLSNCPPFLIICYRLRICFVIFCPKNFVVKKNIRTFASALSPDGGIGRRAGLKHQWGNPCRFDPGSGYWGGESRKTLPAIFFALVTPWFADRLSQGSVEKYWGNKNKKHKKTAFYRCHSPAAALFETGGIAKRTKTARLRRNTQPFYHPKIRIT